MAVLVCLGGAQVAQAKTGKTVVSTQPAVSVQPTTVEEPPAKVLNIKSLPRLNPRGTRAETLSDGMTIYDSGDYDACAGSFQKGIWTAQYVLAYPLDPTVPLSLTQIETIITATGGVPDSSVELRICDDYVEIPDSTTDPCSGTIFYDVFYPIGAVPGAVYLTLPIIQPGDGYCTNDPTIPCTVGNDSPCTPGGGTCTSACVPGPCGPLVFDNRVGGGLDPGDRTITMNMTWRGSRFYPGGAIVRAPANAIGQVFQCGPADVGSQNTRFLYRDQNENDRIELAPGLQPDGGCNGGTCDRRNPVGSVPGFPSTGKWWMHLRGANDATEFNTYGEDMFKSGNCGSITVPACDPTTLAFCAGQFDTDDSSADCSGGTPSDDFLGATVPATGQELNACGSVKGQNNGITGLAPNCPPDPSDPYFSGKADMVLFKQTLHIAPGATVTTPMAFYAAALKGTQTITVTRGGLPELWNVTFANSSLGVFGGVGSTITYTRPGAAAKGTAVFDANIVPSLIFDRVGGGPPCHITLDYANSGLPGITIHGSTTYSNVDAVAKDLVRDINGVNTFDSNIDGLNAGGEIVGEPTGDVFGSTPIEFRLATKDGNLGTITYSTNSPVCGACPKVSGVAVPATVNTTDSDGDGIPDEADCLPNVPNGCQDNCFIECNPPDCNDNNPCTVDSCDHTTGTCSHTAGNAGTECRPSAGACDPAESCNGTSPDCPADALTPAGTVCRASTGECDPAESCDGSNPACPANVFTPAGTACTADGNSCTTDACDGSGNCAHTPVPAGTACTDDGNPCTTDVCDSSGTCTHVCVDADGDGVCDPCDFCPNGANGPTVVIGDCDTHVPNQMVAGSVTVHICERCGDEGDDDHGESDGHHHNCTDHTFGGTGCTIQDLINKCQQITSCCERFTQCVDQVTKELKRRHILTEKQRNKIRKCAQRACHGTRPPHSTSHTRNSNENRP